MPLVTTTGFKPVQPPAGFTIDGVDGLQSQFVLDLEPDTDLESVREKLANARLVRIAFPSFADGRGFSLARRLRNSGYQGHLRAVGHIISDQFRYALECGFDDIEIADELAERQTENDWLANFSPLTSYRQRLQGRISHSSSETHESENAYISQPGVYEQRVTFVEHFSDGLFRFRVTRPQSFRFRSGEFAMIGLPNSARPVFRAYSLASPTWDDELEFYSIKVPGGPLTQHLQKIAVDDTVLLRKKATGTLVLDALSPGKRLFLFSTGTGIAPFASLIRDPDTYEKFDQVVLTHTCRTEIELQYSAALITGLESDPIVGDDIRRGCLKFAASLTRESYPLEGRITDLIRNDDLVQFLDIHPLDPSHDRAMVCGSMAMLNDMRVLLEDLGFTEGSNARPSNYVVERAFVD